MADTQYKPLDVVRASISKLSSTYLSFVEKEIIAPLVRLEYLLTQLSPDEHRGRTFNATEEDHYCSFYGQVLWTYTVHDYVIELLDEKGNVETVLFRGRGLHDGKPYAQHAYGCLEVDEEAMRHAWYRWTGPGYRALFGQYDGRDLNRADAGVNGNEYRCPLDEPVEVLACHNSRQYCYAKYLGVERYCHEEHTPLRQRKRVLKQRAEETLDLLRRLNDARDQLVLLNTYGCDVASTIQPIIDLVEADNGDGWRALAARLCDEQVDPDPLAPFIVYEQNF